MNRRKKLIYPHPKTTPDWDEPFTVLEESENYYIVRYGVMPSEVVMPVEVYLKSDCEEVSKENYKYWEKYFNDKT